MFETKSTTVPITKEMVKAAYRKVKANHGSAGIDNESLDSFDTDLLNNLYKLWNRLSSGSYFPKPVREVSIPKANGNKRMLGIPTVSDRIAQQVIKSYVEPRLEAIFSNHSYGYRPLKSAHQAVNAVRENVRHYAWVIDMDIKNFFDEVSHEMLLKALDCHVEEQWVKMYITRWLEAPSQSKEGELKSKEGRGTPQGGVISPLLANLYLHYVLDKWLAKHYPQVAFVRYADDVIVHCNNEEDANRILAAIRQRLEECKLRLNEEKTGVVYCLNYQNRKKNNYKKKFDFLGFTFKPRSVPSKRGGMFLGYDCAISQSAQTRITEGWKQLDLQSWATAGIQDIANVINPQMIGVIRYYGQINKWSLQLLVRRFHFRIVKWALNRYKSFKGSFRRVYKWLDAIKADYPTMFYHWTIYKTA